MPLYVRDEEVDRLAERARRILNAPTKTDAIRQALEKVVGEAETPIAAGDATRAEKLKKLQDKYRSMGTPNPDFDEKAFLDDMWDGN